jgi:UDP-2,4-diacetamido-2,4,6-trideoxy-beta-L-altropyranose hydrolase
MQIRPGIMKAVFRTDASSKIGSGHVMRCLTLASKLRASDYDIHFICRELHGHMAATIEAQDFRVHLLPGTGGASYPVRGRPVHADWLGVAWQEDAAQSAEVLHRIGSRVSWLVIDHYAIDAGWESLLRPMAERIMVIDDLADRSHDCDLLLDQNLYQDTEQRYAGMVNEDCELLLGPKYSLLRDEFRVQRKHRRKRDGSVKNILVFLGGADPDNATGMVLDAIAGLDWPDTHVDVVIGSSNPNRKTLELQCASMENVSCNCQVTNMAELMNNADLAIGGGGASTWERCALELPALVVSLADNQQPIAEAVASTGVITYLGRREDVTVEDIQLALLALSNHPERLLRQGLISGKLVDGLGNQRILSRMLRYR